MSLVSSTPMLSSFHAWNKPLAMPLQICPRCKRFHYVPGECPAPRVTPSQEGRGGIDPELIVRRAPPAPRLKVLGPGKSQNRDVAVKKSTAAIVGKRGGRPKTIGDMKAYKAQKERERRQKLKEKAE